jgi:hypothetical protein
MYPRDTIYRLARSTKDFQRCHALLAEQGVERSPLSYPTVMALRGETLVGCLSRITSDTAVIAGPLAVSSPRPILTVMRLISAWEGVLWRAGVRSYHFGIDTTQHKEWLRMIEKVGLVPYHTDEQYVWFKRELKERDHGWETG